MKTKRYHGVPKRCTGLKWVNHRNCLGSSDISNMKIQIIKPLLSNVLFLYLLKTKGFLTFSEGIETEHWAKMS